MFPERTQPKYVALHGYSHNFFWFFKIMVRFMNIEKYKKYHTSAENGTLKILC